MRGRIAELPDGVVAYRTTPVFTEATIPPGLLSAHRTRPGVWGLIEVLEGRLHFRVPASGFQRMLVPDGQPAVAEPGIAHEVSLDGPVKFQITFYRRPEPGDRQSPR